jgi:hypothetical protein
VPVDLDQLGREDSHGTIIGGKGFIQPGHGPADGGPFFEKVHVISGAGQIKGALHAGNSRACDHNSSRYTVRHEISPCVWNSTTGAYAVNKSKQKGVDFPVCIGRMKRLKTEVRKRNSAIRALPY